MTYGYLCTMDKEEGVGASDGREGSGDVILNKCEGS